MTRKEIEQAALADPLIQDEFGNDDYSMRLIAGFAVEQINEALEELVVQLADPEAHLDDLIRARKIE